MLLLYKETEKIKKKNYYLKQKTGSNLAESDKFGKKYLLLKHAFFTR